MVRVSDLQASLRFYRDGLGLVVQRQQDVPQGRFSLVYLAAPGDTQAQIELTHNWDEHAYNGGRNFGHVAYQVDDLYALCSRLLTCGSATHRFASAKVFPRLGWNCASEKAATARCGA